MRVVVLRIGHRVGRDKRVSTHVGLVARAFGASGIIYAGEVEESVVESLRRVVETWGGPFTVEVAPSYKRVIRRWKEEGGVVVHLTMYGENVEGSDVIDRIKRLGKDILVIVGAEKVPWEVYEMADFNVAIGNQPHSEVAALAVLWPALAFAGNQETAEQIARQLHRQKSDAVEDVKGLKPQADAGGMVEQVGEVGGRVLFQQRHLHPPQVPEILPAIEAVAGDGRAQMPGQGPGQQQG